MTDKGCTICGSRSHNRSACRLNPDKLIGTAAALWEANGWGPRQAMEHLAVLAAREERQAIVQVVKGLNVAGIDTVIEAIEEGKRA